MTNRKRDNKRYFGGEKSLMYFSTIFTKIYNPSTPELHVLYTNDDFSMNIIYRFGVGYDYLSNTQCYVTYLGRIQNQILIDDTCDNDMTVQYSNYIRTILNDVRNIEYSRLNYIPIDV
jgi:hypothetical protein